MLKLCEDNRVFEVKLLPYCQRCGAKLGENDRFCQRCGTPVAVCLPFASPPPPPPPVQPSEPHRSLMHEPLILLGIALIAILIVAVIIVAVLFAINPPSFNPPIGGGNVNANWVLGYRLNV